MLEIQLIIAVSQAKICLRSFSFWHDTMHLPRRVCCAWTDVEERGLITRESLS